MRDEPAKPGAPGYAARARSAAAIAAASSLRQRQRHHLRQRPFRRRPLRPLGRRRPIAHPRRIAHRPCRRDRRPPHLARLRRFQRPRQSRPALPPPARSAAAAWPASSCASRCAGARAMTSRYCVTASSKRPTSASTWARTVAVSGAVSPSAIARSSAAIAASGCPALRSAVPRLWRVIRSPGFSASAAS